VADCDKRLRQVELERATPTAAASSVATEFDVLKRVAMSRLNDLGAEFATSPEHARKTLSAFTAGERFRLVGSDAVPGLLMAGTAPGRLRPQGGSRQFEISYPAESFILSVAA
jgi:hypothetical protein